MILVLTRGQRGQAWLGMAGPSQQPEKPVNPRALVSDIRHRDRSWGVGMRGLGPEQLGLYCLLLVAVGGQWLVDCVSGKELEWAYSYSSLGMKVERECSRRSAGMEVTCRGLKCREGVSSAECGGRGTDQGSKLPRHSL